MAYSPGMVDTTPGPGNTSNLKKAVAKRALWGTPGDFKRCHAFLVSKGVEDGKADRICGRWHIENNGYATGDKRNT
jgi:hypothetical protein